MRIRYRDFRKLIKILQQSDKYTIDRHAHMFFRILISTCNYFNDKHIR